MSFPLETASAITCRSGKDLCASGETESARDAVREGDVDGSPGGSRPKMRQRGVGGPQE